jgi:Phosphotransferase enzyme family
MSRHHPRRSHCADGSPASPADPWSSVCLTLNGHPRNRELRAWWSSTEWRETVEPWIGRALADGGLRQTGEIAQPRVRIWSTQLTIPTNAGLVWFKENNPTQAFEAALVAVLAAVSPSRVVTPLAFEPKRGWLLTRDQGATLYETAGGDERRWARLLSEYAMMQRAVVPHADTMLATGLPRFAPDDAVTYVARQAVKFAESPDGLADAALAAVPRLTAVAERLAEGPIPLSLEHNDLHSNNAFVGPHPESPSEQLRFFDFADAVWGHPLTTLHVPINVLQQHWTVEASDPRITYVVDAYLDVWSDLASRGELKAILDDALVFGPANRFFTWQRVLEYADADGLAEFGEAPARWLATLLSR